jgi:hypothetical protein
VMRARVKRTQYPILGLLSFGPELGTLAL